MEFFGITLYGPQNYIGDLMNKEYREPTRKEEVLPLMQKIVGQSTCPEKIMFRSYKPKTDRKNISEENIKDAIREVLSKTLSICKAADKYGIKATPTETLQHDISGRNQGLLSLSFQLGKTKQVSI